MEHRILTALSENFVIVSHRYFPEW